MAVYLAELASRELEKFVLKAKSLESSYRHAEYCWNLSIPSIHKTSTQNSNSQC